MIAYLLVLSIVALSVGIMNHRSPAIVPMPARPGDLARVELRPDGETYVYVRSYQRKAPAKPYPSAPGHVSVRATRSLAARASRPAHLWDANPRHTP